MGESVWQSAGSGDRRRCALMVLCLGVLMISVNAAIVDVALPSIRNDLHFSDPLLVWVVNAYLIAFGGFLLLGGCLGDAIGHRRLFAAGVALFTAACLGCGVAPSAKLLVAARAVQGLSAAIVSAAALSQIANLFAEGPERARALGIYVFASATGGVTGLVLGGLLTHALGWQWVFLVNVPVGLSAYALSMVLLPYDRRPALGRRIDVAGALTGTVALMAASYAAISSSEAGWLSARTALALVGAAALLVFFGRIEARAQVPLLPMELLRTRNLVVMSIVGALLTAAVLAWRFISTLYLQLVLNLTPLQVSALILPANLIVACMSLMVSPLLVARFGIRWSLVVGALAVSAGLALLARSPVRASVMLDVLPGVLVVGFGIGMAYTPLWLGALGSVSRYNSGAASGLVNTALALGSALGLSVLTGIAGARTNHVLQNTADAIAALNSGYRAAFYCGAILAALAAAIVRVGLRINVAADKRM